MPDIESIESESIEFTSLEFPIIGNKSTAVSTDTTFVQYGPATPATEEDLIKDEHGYTNTNLHRRIVDKGSRSMTGALSTGQTTFTSNLVKGRVLILTGHMTVLEICSCEYGSEGQWTLLTEGEDYNPQLEPSYFAGVNGFRSVRLLSTSNIIPETADATKKLRVTYIYDGGSEEKLQENDYVIEIQGVNSYRTTTYYLHTEEAGSPFENEIP